MTGPQQRRERTLRFYRVATWVAFPLALVDIGNAVLHFVDGNVFFGVVFFIVGASYVAVGISFALQVRRLQRKPAGD